MEYVTLIGDKIHTARKNYTCDECRRTISKKESYRREFYYWEGKAYSHRTCAHCSVVRDYLNKNGIEFYYRGVYEELGNGVEYWKDRFYLNGMKNKWIKKDGSPWKIPKIL